MAIARFLSVISGLLDGGETLDALRSILVKFLEKPYLAIRSTAAGAMGHALAGTPYSERILFVAVFFLLLVLLSSVDMFFFASYLNYCSFMSILLLFHSVVPYS